MASRDALIILSDLTGGRNGTDPPHAMPENQCVEALNVDWYQTTFARKRGGAAAFTITGVTFAGVISTALTHTPAADDSKRELWLIDATPTVGRTSASTTFSSPTLKDAISGTTQTIHGASLNGKLFLSYDSAVDRLHVWDTSTVRRVGMATPAAPTAADTGSGSYAATARNYKVCYIEKSGSDIIRRSEPSALVAFTPSGSGTAARVTKPAAVSEGETHWELYGAADAIYVLLATTVVGTTTVDDSTAPASYLGDAIPVASANVVPVSWKYLVSDGNRLLGAGSWETGNKNNRVWFTPVLGSSDVGDDERIPNTTSQKNFIDIDENDGDVITGFGPALSGQVLVFKRRSTWALVTTGISTAPFRRFSVSGSIGCIAQKSVLVAPDENGDAAVYWMSAKGPYRLGTSGLQFMGRDNEDVWLTMNLDATTVICHGVSFVDKHQVWWWLSTGANNDPDTLMVFDTELGRLDELGFVRGGWSKFDGNLASARCSVAYASSIAASAPTRSVPCLGQHGAAARFWHADTGTADAGTAFKATVKTGLVIPWGLGRNGAVSESHLLAKASAGVTITQTIDRDYGLQTRTSTALLTAAGSETRVQKQFEGSSMADAGVVQFQVGDASAASNTWQLDALIVPATAKQQR